MSDPLSAKANSQSAAKVVVFGVDDDCRPHAACFPKAQADSARTAAKQLRFNVIEVTNGLAADVVGKLPAGRIHAHGPAAVPPVREDLYEKLVATLNPRGEAGRDRDEPIATDMPITWDAIKAGHVVLATDSLTEGWWAAVVVARAGDKLTLRWRDYPGWPKFTMRATAVALLNPTTS